MPELQLRRRIWWAEVELDGARLREQSEAYAYVDARGQPGSNVAHNRMKGYGAQAISWVVLHCRDIR